MLISNLIATWPILPHLFFFMLCKVSYATKMLSVINLYGTKALWELEIKFGRISFNRLTNILDMILYSTLHKLMGRYCMINSGSLVLGISAMWVLFIFRSMIPEFRHDSTALITSALTTCQNFWKKNGLISESLGNKWLLCMNLCNSTINIHQYARYIIEFNVTKTINVHQFLDNRCLEKILFLLPLIVKF